MTMSGFKEESTFLYTLGADNYTAAEPSGMKVCVLGGGAFGTAMSVMFARNGHDVCILVRSDEHCRSINEDHRNNQVFSEFALSAHITATTDPKSALDGACLAVFCIPVQASIAYLARIKPYIADNVPVISTSKGINAQTKQLMCDVLKDHLHPNQPLAFFSGPSFAKEMLMGMPTTVCIACTPTLQGALFGGLGLGSFIAKQLSNELMRVYLVDDVVGLELGGALKNPLAIGAGIIEGLGLGSNTMASFVTRGCSEMRKFATAMGAKKETLNGLSGIGDLVLTCYGGLSRNRTVGVRLGKGEKLSDIVASLGQVAEGIATASVVVELAKELHLDLPIFNMIHKFINGDLSPQQALKILMLRPIKFED